MNGVDGHFALLVAKHHSTQHHLFRKLLRFRLHHQHCGFSTRHHQIQQAVFALCLAGVEHVFTVDIAHASCAQRATEWNARHAQSGRHGNHGGNVGVHFGVERQGVDDHMHFVQEPFGKQRANGAVDQTAGQGFQLARLGFALEKAAWNLACSVGFFNVIDREREEVLAGLGRLRGYYCGQNHGAFHIQQHSAGRLASDFAGFHSDRMLAPLEGFGDFIKHRHLHTPEQSRAVQATSQSPERTTQNTMPFQRYFCKNAAEPLWNDTASLCFRLSDSPTI